MTEPDGTSAYAATPDAPACDPLATPPGTATVTIATELLVEVLHMPSDTRILAAACDSFRGVVRLRVQSPAFPGVIGDVNPTIIHHRERYEWDWNLPAANRSAAVPSGDDDDTHT